MPEDKSSELAAKPVDLTVHTEGPTPTGSLSPTPAATPETLASGPDGAPSGELTADPANSTTKIAPASPRRGLDRLADQARPLRLRRKPFPWKRLVALVVVLLVAAGAYVFYQINQPPAVPQYTTQPADGSRPVSVSIGSNGQVQPNASLDLTFGSTGKVAKLYKKPGDKVKTGDKLAELDPTDLQAALKAAQLSLDQEQARYQKSIAGASDKDLEAAQATVEEAVANLNKTVNGSFTDQDVASANASIAAATAQLDKTRSGPTPAELSAAQASISAAEKQLASAKAKLDQTKAGGSSQEVAAANAAISSAEAQLASAKAKLAKTMAGNDAATIASAQSAYDQAVANQKKTLSQLNLAIESDKMAKQEALLALQDAQEKYREQVTDNRNADGSLKSNLTQAEIDAETTALRTMQAAQDTYNKADLTLNDANVQLQTQTLTLQSTVDNAKAQLDKAKAGPTQADIAADEAGVASAQASLDNAKKALSDLTPTDAQVAADEASLTSAEASLASARKALLALYPTQSQIAADEASLASAQANLAKLKGGSQDEVTAAETRLKESQAALEELKNGPNPNDLAVAKASLDVAKLNVEKAQAALDALVLKAPFSGTITRGGLVEGQSVTAGTTVYQLVDSSSFHVDVSVSETDIGKIKEGVPVAINLEGVPNRSFSGKVTFVSTSATVNNNVVSYAVTVTLDNGNNNSLLDAYKAEFDKFLQTPAGNKQAEPTGATPGTPGDSPPKSAGGTPVSGASGPGVPTTGGGITLNLGSSDGICGYNPLSLLGVSSDEGDEANPRAGMSATVTFCLDLKAASLSVLNRAVKTKIENGKLVRYVQVLVDKATGKVEDRAVLTGVVGDTVTEITGGDLKPGDAVVTGVVSLDGSDGGTGKSSGGPQVMIGGPGAAPAAPVKDAVFVNK